ncbi:hypothetical protein [Streptomyces sp. NPDC003635]
MTRGTSNKVEEDTATRLNDAQRGDHPRKAVRPTRDHPGLGQEFTARIDGDLCLAP